MRSKIATIISAFTGLAAVVVVSATPVTVQAAGPQTTAVAIGESHVVAAATAGSLWTWGSLTPGPRGAGSRYSLSKPTEVVLPGGREADGVAATRQSSAVAATDGTVWAWGYLGLGLGDSSSTTSTDYLNPVQVAFGSTRIKKIAGDCEGYIAIDTNNEVWQWGSFWGVWSLSSSRPVKVAGISGAVEVYKSCSSAYAVLSDGTVKAWGSNGGGKLGDGSTNDRQSPVVVSISGKSVSSLSVSESHVLALASDGSVWGWGSNNGSQLAADPAAIQYSTTPRRITISGGSGSVVNISATSGWPSSFAVLSSGEVWEWGYWSQSQFAPRKRAIPTSELGSTRLVKLIAYYQNMVYVGSDNSIWAKGQYGQYGSLVDGNCGADAYEYSQWVNGRTIPPRYLVRTISSGQFGPTYNEDTLSLRGLNTSTGTLLPLDGSGTAVGRQGVEFSIVATAPASACYQPNQLTITWDFDGDGIYETSGVASVNDGESVISTGTYTFNWSGRRRGGVKITNPDGVSQTYSFWMGVAAAAGSGGGGGSVSALPIAETSEKTTMAIGTDGFIYGWGRETAALGTATVLPRRLFPNSSNTFTKIRFTRSYYNAQYSIAGVMNSSGQVQIWGKTQTNYLFFDGNGQGTHIATSPYQIPLPAGVNKWIDFSFGIWADGYRYRTSNLGVYVKLIGDDQQLYVHGIKSARCTGSSTSIPESPMVASGLNFTEFGPRELIKGIDGWKYWNLVKIGSSTYNYCDTYNSSNCVSQPIEYFGPLSATPSDGYVEGRDSSNYCYWGGSSSSLEISSTGQVELVVRSTAFDTDGCYRGLVQRGSIREVSRTNISNWSNKTAVTINATRGRWGDMQTRILASDGTLWEWARWSQTPLRPINADPNMASIRRFAGGSNYVVTADSALWTMPMADDYDVVSGTHLGSCAAARSNDRAAGARVYSTGQFGAQFAEDRFGFQVDAPMAIYNEQFPDQSYHARYNDWSGSPSLSLRPTSSAQLYGYVSSSCDGANVTRVEWDMDDNGTYESLGTITSVTADATPIATQRINRYGEVTYSAFDASWKQVMTPSMDLSTPGGRYIGVKLTSAFGVQTKRFTVLVQPKKPSGYVGMTINSGARFTESTDVELTLTWPEGATTALISNDGGFTSAQEVPLSRTVRWKLPAVGTGQLGTNVYVRYFNIYPDGNGSWSKDEMGYQVLDDIVLDLAAPTVSNVSAASSQALAAALRMDGIARSAVSEQFANVNVSAVDSASGIAGMQVASDPAVPGPIRPYSSQVRVSVDRERVAVRVQDNVGHWSPWTYARVSGFVASPETPAPEPVRPSPTPVTPAPAPSPQVAPAAPTPSVNTPPAATTPSAKAVLLGTTAKVTVSIPTTLAKTCTTKTVKGKKTTSCVASQITVSVTGGATRKVTAKAGSNAISMPKVKKGQTITVKVGSKVISRIKVK